MGRSKQGQRLFQGRRGLQDSYLTVAVEWTSEAPNNDTWNYIQGSVLCRIHLQFYPYPFDADFPPREPAILCGIIVTLCMAAMTYLLWLLTISSRLAIWVRKISARP